MTWPYIERVDSQPYLERVASQRRPAPPEEDINPAFAVMADVNTVAQQQKAKGAKLPPVNRDRTPAVRRGGGSPLVEAAIRTIERNQLTEEQRAKLRELIS